MNRSNKILNTSTFLLASCAICIPAYGQDFSSEAGLDTTQVLDPSNRPVAEDTSDPYEEWEERFEPAGPLRGDNSVSTKYTQSSIETPASVSVITRDQIQRFGYRSVGEALQSLAGVYVSYDLVNYHVGLRGAFGGARAGSRLLKIMIDGVAIPLTQAETYLLGPEFVPIAAVERIELLRGPASSLYGAGAFAGAINVVTRRAAYEGETKVRASGGGFGGAGGRIMAGGDAVVEVTAAESHVLVAGAFDYEDRSNLAIPDTGKPSGLVGESDKDIGTPFSVYGKMDQRVAGGRLSANGLVQGHSRDAQFHDLAPLGDTHISMTNYRVMAGYERGFGYNWTFDVGAGLGGASPTSNDRFQVAGENFYIKRGMSSFQLLGKAEVRRDFDEGGFVLAGFDGFTGSEQLPTYTEYSLATDLPVTTSTPRIGRDISVDGGGAFTQVLLPVAGVVTLSGSGRVDFNNQTESAAQGAGRIGAVTSFSDRIALKLIAGSSYKSPSPEQLYALPIVNERDVVGARIGDGYDLATQYLYGLEGVVEVYPTRWSHISASGFYNIYVDTIGYQLEGTRLIPRNYDATNLGFEAAGRVFYRFQEQSAFDFGVSLSYQTTKTEEIEGAISVEKFFPDNEIVPVVMLKTRAGITLAPAYSNLAVELNYIGERVPSQSNLTVAGTTSMLDPSYTLDPYALLNVTYSTTPLALADYFEMAFVLKGENLLDTGHAEIGFNGVDVPSLGRTFWLRMNFTL